MNEIKVVVHNVEELKHAFMQLPDALAKRVLGQAVYAGIKVLQQTAQQTAPERTDGMGKKISSKGKGSQIRRNPGYLKRHVTIKKVDSTPTVARMVTGPSKGAFYGTFDELGSKHQVAKPWLRPASEQGREPAIAAFIKSASAGTAREVNHLNGPFNWHYLTKGRY